jgi:hypothetical protein
MKTFFLFGLFGTLLTLSPARATTYFPKLQREFVAELENLLPSGDLSPVLGAPHLINKLPATRSFDEMSAETFKAALQLSFIHCTHYFHREWKGEIPKQWTLSFTDAERAELFSGLKGDIDLNPALTEKLNQWMMEFTKSLLGESLPLNEQELFLTEIKLFTAASPSSLVSFESSLTPFILFCTHTLSSPKNLMGTSP